MIENEKLIVGNPISIKHEDTKIIIEQMEKYIYRITLNEGTKRSGFFFKIPFITKDRLLSVLIINNHIIKEEIL